MAKTTLEAIKYTKGSLEILNQLLLPFESTYEKVSNIQEGHDAIKLMKVRGAPAIAIVAALSLAVELSNKQTYYLNYSVLDAVKNIRNSLEYLKTSRPTAVNLFEASKRLLEQVETASLDQTKSAWQVCLAYIESAEKMMIDDLNDNKAIGSNGMNFILDKFNDSKSIRVLTHCNTGSLATSGHGTALGIIRNLHFSGRLEHAYCTETRPYNQGSRLTAYELVHEGIPSTLICDSMASALLKTKDISAIIVGADRVAANGDTANKIGTYQLAIAAAYHGVMFIVAAPTTSIDLLTSNGDLIEIEERKSIEVTTIKGKLEDKEELATVQIAAAGINVWNPAFDVVPASLISAIVTEKEVFVKPDGSKVFVLS